MGISRASGNRLTSLFGSTKKDPLGGTDGELTTLEFIALKTANFEPTSNMVKKHGSFVLSVSIDTER